MSIKEIHGTIDMECDYCGKTATVAGHTRLLSSLEWHCSSCMSRGSAKLPRSISLHITKCEEYVFEDMKKAIGKMASDCHAIIGSHSVESETHEIE